MVKLSIIPTSLGSAQLWAKVGGEKLHMVSYKVGPNQL